MLSTTPARLTDMKEDLDRKGLRTHRDFQAAFQRIAKRFGVPVHTEKRPAITRAVTVAWVDRSHWPEARRIAQEYWDRAKKNIARRRVPAKHV